MSGEECADRYMFLLELRQGGYITEDEFQSTYRRLINIYAYELWPGHPMWSR